MIQTAVDEGFVQPHNATLISFVNGPGPDASMEEHENFDWGRAAIKVIENWKRDPGECPYDWTARRSGGGKDELDAI